MQLPEQLSLFDAAAADTPEERRRRHQAGECQQCGATMAGEWLAWDGGLYGWCEACTQEATDAV